MKLFKEEKRPAKRKKDQLPTGWITQKKRKLAQVHKSGKTAIGGEASIQQTSAKVPND